MHQLNVANANFISKYTHKLLRFGKAIDQWICVDRQCERHRTSEPLLHRSDEFI